ncbi:hypothetical protein VTN31DRAFT_2720 [Thermomyces dupontii]|uniref:uncharacterized protein n=1 Tax=Talaromyces thermophilus TaxID=28565 RepID=UPI0037431563
MNFLRLQKKYPELPQSELFSLQEAFRRLDVEDKGYLDESTVIKATQQSERLPYDVVRQTLRSVELDSSRRVEFEDYVDLIAKLRSASHAQAPPEME